MNNNFDIILSIIVGVILGWLFYSIRFSNIHHHGPNSKNIINKVYRVKDKCYKLVPRVTICPSNISMSK
jgi:hypothetical protein